MKDEQRQAAKKRMMALMQEGYSWQEAARLSGIQTSRSIAYRWFHQFRTQGEAVLHDSRKDQVMTVCKLALANLAMWTRNHYFPTTYAHATWARLAPFFQLRGVVVSTQRTVSVELCPFNDRQYNRDLIALCQRVNERQVCLPDGRLLVFSVKETCRPILHRQKRLIA